MPISGERRLVKVLGRIGLWFSSLLLAGLLFAVCFGLILGGAGSILLIFRITMTFELPVWCLCLPVLIAFRNTEAQRMPMILLGGILIGPVSMALWGLALECGGGDTRTIWHGDPLTGMGGFTAMLFGLIVGSLTTFFYFLGLKAAHRLCDR
jgi:hypothetical protein